ncbi:hypothetical protein IH785_13195 [candidate division KSB1 bacterium]|nr:hypothetical protein [candidate division KSB1 bacterium]
MADIQVGDKVRILVNYSVKGHLWLPSNPSKHLKSIKAEHLKDKLGIVIPTMRALPDDEVFVKLDNGWTVIISKSHLTVVPAKKTQ